MEAIEISDEFIKLGQALKLAGLVSSGVEAKIVIQNGEVTVNGEVDTRRGRKLYPQDIRVMEWFLRNGERMAVKRPEIWEKVIGLKKKGYNIYILSNYSKELFEMHTKDASFLKVLDGGIVSYQVKEIKPGRRIYELLLEKYDLKAEECLFFDDRADNVEAARNMGIEAIQVTSREMLNEILDKMLSE